MSDLRSELGWTACQSSGLVSASCPVEAPGRDALSLGRPQSASDRAADTIERYWRNYGHIGEYYVVLAWSVPFCPMDGAAMRIPVTSRKGPAAANGATASKLP